MSILPHFAGGGEFHANSPKFNSPLNANSHTLKTLTISLINELSSYISPHLNSSFIHGDFCFSNIAYDFKANLPKIFDPRGADFTGFITPFGDARYDYAKLMHSVLGLYDFIIANFARLNAKNSVNSANLKANSNAKNSVNLNAKNSLNLANFVNLNEQNSANLNANLNEQNSANLNAKNSLNLPNLENLNENLNTQTLEFTLPKHIKLIQEAFLQVFDFENPAEIYAITAHLFISMLPLHADSPARQRLLLANAFRMGANLRRGEFL